MFEIYDTPSGRMADLDVHAFRSWVEEQASKGVSVGHANHQSRCPVATWLRSVYGLDAYVYGSSVYVNGGMSFFVPAWVEAIEGASDAVYQGQCVEVMASDVLQLLEGVVRV